MLVVKDDPRSNDNQTIEGIRPEEEWVLANKPYSSNAFISLRIVAELEAMPSSINFLEPTGKPVFV